MPNKAQKNLIFNRLGYYPSVEQEAIHDCPARTRLVAGGERAGKSKLAANDLLSRFYEGLLYWLVAADYARTRAEYDYICEGLDKLGAKFTFSKQVDPGEIYLPLVGISIVTKSANDPRKLAMEPPDGIIGCEASQLDYETYLRLRGRLIEKRGWMLLAGTFESSLGWYPELYVRGQAPNDEDLVSFSMPTWSNIHIFPGGREDAEIKKVESMMPSDHFSERFGGVPSPPKGLVFKEFSNKTHTGIGGNFDFDPVQEVNLWVDPGYAEAYAVQVVQIKNDEVWMIDEIYERGVVTSDIIKIAKQRPWWNKVSGGVIDIAGTQHQAMAAPAEVWLKEGGIPLTSNKVRIQDGIERMKTFLLINPKTGQPMMHINARCKGIISELGGCPNPITGQTAAYIWKEGKDGTVIGDTPLDKYNHSCKATAYGLVNRFGYSSELTPTIIKAKYF